MADTPDKQEISELVGLGQTLSDQVAEMRKKMMDLGLMSEDHPEVTALSETTREIDSMSAIRLRYAQGLAESVASCYKLLEHTDLPDQIKLNVATYATNYAEAWLRDKPITQSQD